MKVLTLNIRHGGGKRAGRILDSLAEAEADALVLTEYRENSNSDPFKSRLFQLGYKWQAASSIVPTENAVFLASKIPFVSNGQLGDPRIHSHRLLFAEFPTFKLVGVYFPQNEAKRPVFDFLISNAPRLLGPLGLLIGDFNTGKPYLDEAGRTFACTDRLDTLEAVGLIDAWRSRNPETREFSWLSSAKNGFRIDHVFCTAGLNTRITRIAYAHRFRDERTTDHSALIAEFDC